MLKTIETQAQYDKALAHVYELMQTDIKANSSTANELEILSILVEEYELKQYPVPQPNSLDAIKTPVKLKGLQKNNQAIKANRYDRT